MLKHLSYNLLVRELFIRLRITINEKQFTLITEILYRYVILLILFFFSNKANCQISDSVMVSGLIKNNNESRLTLYVRDYFVIPNSYSVQINSDGSFQTKVPILSSGSIEVVYNDTLLSLYVPKDKNLFLTWQGDKFFQSVQVNKEDVLNEFIISYQQKFVELSATLFEKADLQKDRKSYMKIVDSLNEQEFAFLKTQGIFLDTLSYQKVAYDIFYTNLYKLMNSSFMKGYSFAARGNGEDVGSGFPFITLKDKKFDSLVMVSLIDLKDKNPSLDNFTLNKYANIQAVQSFKNKFSVVDPAALELSREYRYFLNDYFLNLTFEVYYRNLGKNMLSSTNDFASLVRSVVKNEIIADWLISQKIYGVIFYDGSKLDQADFEQQLNNINLKLAKERLRNAYKFYQSLKRGSPAPTFSVLNKSSKSVMVEQFKGQFVYIEFWESACLPCIHDITRYSSLVADMYKDSNVVFLYVSLDSDKRKWDISVAKYKPKGINLLAQDGWNNSVVQQYGIFAVPRSVIIAPDGTIHNSQGPRLSELMIKNFFQ